MTKKSQQETATTTNIPIIIDAKPEQESNFSPELIQGLTEINQVEGVLGYILKNDVAATIDLKDPQKTTEYALLSSQTLEAAKTFGGVFEMGNLENIVVKCTSLQVLCVDNGKYTVNVFLEKTAKQEKVLALLRRLNS